MTINEQQRPILFKSGNILFTQGWPDSCQSYGRPSSPQNLNSIREYLVSIFFYRMHSLAYPQPQKVKQKACGEQQGTNIYHNLQEM